MYPGETPADFPQDVRPGAQTSLHGEPATDPRDRALNLLAALRDHQIGLPPSAAQAWERVAFSEVFDHPGPAQRIRSFLEKA